MIQKQNNGKMRLILADMSDNNKKYIDVNSLIPGKIYRLTFKNPCFVNYKIIEGIYSNGNCLTYNYNTMPSDKNSREYRFIFLAIESACYFYGSIKYTILKMLVDGKIAYSFINNTDKTATVYES